MRIVGYTGARRIAGHENKIAALLAELDDVDAFVTGGCMGLDAYVGSMVARRYPKAEHRVIVPANRGAVTYWWLLPEFAKVVRPSYMPVETSYRARNLAILRESTELHAFPQHLEHDPRSQRSGSWQTVRLARKLGMPVSVRVLNPVLWQNPASPERVST